MKTMPDIENNQVLAVCYKLPKPLERFVPPVLMPGARPPDPVVGERDLPPPPKLRHVDQLDQLRRYLRQAKRRIEIALTCITQPPHQESEQSPP